MIDTAEKRRAAAGVRRGPRVTPNVGKDAEWRAQAGRNYSGIPFDGAPAVSDAGGAMRLWLGIRIGM